MVRVVEVRHVAGHILWIRFDDGTSGEVDLSQEIWGVVFEPLRDVENFRKVGVHPDLHTIAWPNGADFAPEFLYDQVRSAVGQS